MKCKKGYDVIPMKSAMGWYLGTRDEKGFPNCRISNEYSKTEEEAYSLLMDRQTNCMENEFCNGGKGCFEKEIKSDSNKEDFCEKITVMIFDNNEKKPYLKEINNDLKSLQEVVGGRIGLAYPINKILKDDYIFIVNDDIQIPFTDIDMNKFIFDTEEIIYGTFLITKGDDDNFISLDKKDYNKIIKALKSVK